MFTPFISTAGFHVYISMSFRPRRLQVWTLGDGLSWDSANSRRDSPLWSIVRAESISTTFER